jgi:hypothetical protein
MSSSDKPDAVQAYQGAAWLGRRQALGRRSLLAIFQFPFWCAGDRFEMWQRPGSEGIVRKTQATRSQNRIGPVQYGFPAQPRNKGGLGKRCNDARRQEGQGSEQANVDVLQQMPSPRSQNPIGPVQYPSLFLEIWIGAQPEFAGARAAGTGVQRGIADVEGGDDFVRRRTRLDKIISKVTLERRIKEGAIPIISDVPGFRAYYIIYAPDDTVTAISIFDNYAGAEESNNRALAWIEQSLAPLLA